MNGTDRPGKARSPIVYTADTLHTNASFSLTVLLLLGTSFRDAENTSAGINSAELAPSRCPLPASIREYSSSRVTLAAN